jgi:hypothetical protein
MLPLGRYSVGGYWSVNGVVKEKKIEKVNNLQLHHHQSDVLVIE